MYPKATGYFCNLSSFLCCKSYCFFLKLLIVLPIHLSLLHFTPPKVLRLYYNLTLRCVHYFGGSADIEVLQFIFSKQTMQLKPKESDKEIFERIDTIQKSPNKLS